MVQASKAPRPSCLTEKDGETCLVCAKPRKKAVCKRRGQLERAAASAFGAVRSTGRDSDSRKLYSPSRESLSVLALAQMAGGRLEHRATGTRSVKEARRAEAREAATSHGSSSIPMSSLGSPAVAEMRTVSGHGLKFKPQLWLAASQIKSWFSKKASEKKKATSVVLLGKFQAQAGAALAAFQKDAAALDDSSDDSGSESGE